MKRSLLVLLLAIGLALPSIASAVLIDYNEGLGPNPGGPFPEIGDYYSALPGAPVHSPGFRFVDYSLYGYDPIYGPHSEWGLTAAPWVNPVWIDWSADVADISFWYGFDGNLGTPLVVEGYNGGTLVFNSGDLPQNSSGMFQYSLPKVAIDRLVFYGAPNLWSMDDLSYAPVPEPTYPEPANTIAASYGNNSMIGSGVFNEIALLFVPVGAVILLRISRRKR